MNNHWKLDSVVNVFHSSITILKPAYVRHSNILVVEVIPTDLNRRSNVIDNVVNSVELVSIYIYKPFAFSLNIELLMKLKMFVTRDKILDLVANSKSITIITHKEDLVIHSIMEDVRVMVIGLQTKENVKLFVLFMKSRFRATTKV